MIIRDFDLNDCEAIYHLNCDEMGYDYPLDDTKAKLSKLIGMDSHKILVAVVDEKVVGYVHANDYDVIYAPHMKNIMGIAVSRQYKQKGIGRMLLCGIEKWAKETGASGVRLCSGSSRTKAHMFYEHCGYSCEKTQLNFKKMLY